MEYVGGQSLRQILLERARTAGRSLPVEHALAYVIEVLPRVRLPARPRAGLLRLQAGQRDPDRGAAQAHRPGRRAADRRRGQPDLRHGRLPGTRDRDRRARPPSSDLYTVGRALAVLTFEFTGYQSTYQHTLARPGDRAAARAARVVLPAAAAGHRPRPRPPVRVGRRDGRAAHRRAARGARDRRRQPRPAFSTLFSPELQAIGTGAGELDGSDWATAVDALPQPVPGRSRAAGAPGGQHRPGRRLPGHAGHAGPGAADGRAVRRRRAAKQGRRRRWPSRRRPGSLWPVPSSSPGRSAGAASTLAELAPATSDWRVTWYQGLRELAAGQPGAARAAFDAVYDALPGELAPKLALAFAAEAAGDAGDRRPLLRARVDGRPVLRQRRVRAGQDPLAADDRAGAIAALAGCRRRPAIRGGADRGGADPPHSAPASPGPAAGDLRRSGRRWTG